jgi:hypothetical protein
MKKLTAFLTAGCSLGLASLGYGLPVLNEIVVNDVSTDTHEFFEICGDPGSSLTGLTLVVIEGEGTPAGTIDIAIGLTGVVPANGLYVLGTAALGCQNQTMSANVVENGGETILLVSGFSSSVGTDVDPENDGVANFSIGTIVDGLGFRLPSSGDLTYYGVQNLGPDTGTDGTANFDVAGAARCADCTGAWGIICLDGTEGAPVCDTNNPFTDYNVSNATPCGPNACPPISVDQSTWGGVKGKYR